MPPASPTCLPVIFCLDVLCFEHTLNVFVGMLFFGMASLALDSLYLKEYATPGNVTRKQQVEHNSMGGAARHDKTAGNTANTW